MIQSKVLASKLGFLRVRTVIRKSEAVSKIADGPTEKILCSKRRVKSKCPCSWGPNVASAVAFMAVVG